MGDIADDIYNRFVDGFYDDEEDEEWGGPQPRARGVVCRHCGARKCLWANDGGSWVLLNSDLTRHNCRPVATAGDFEN